jgi:rhodanese-related sulfurtransferase
MENTNKKLVYLALGILVVAVILIIIFVSKKVDFIEENNSTDYIDVSATEAKAIIDENPNLIIIDVSPNYAEGHLPGAINYYIGDGSLDEAIPTLDKEATYLIYCRIDSASRAGAQKLVDAGFENVYRLESHYSGWVEAGYEVEM